MTDRLVEDIFELVKTMNTDEVEAFEMFAQEKGRGKKTNSEGLKYLELFRVYNSHREKPEIKSAEILREASFSKNPNELNQHLCERLETFLAICYREGHGATLKKIDADLDTITELVRRKRWRHAGELLAKSAKVILELPGHHFDERFLYLSLRLYSLQQNWNIKQLLTEPKRKQLEIFESVIRPFNTLAGFLPKINGNESFEQLPSPELQESCFFGILSTWLREHKKLEYLKKTLPARDRFTGMFNIHRAEQNSSNAKNKNRAIDQMISGMDAIVRLEKMYLSVCTGNPWELKEQTEELLRDVRLVHNPVALNPELTAFVYSQMLRFTALSEHKTSSEFLERLIALDKISKVELHQFTEDQVEDISYRLGLNKIVILFLQRKHEDLVATLSAIGFETKSKQYEEYFFDVIGIELLARLQIGKFDDDTTKLIRKYEHNLKPSMGGASDFHSALRKIISAFNEVDRASERGKVVELYIEQLRVARNPTNHFQKVIVLWLEDWLIQ